MSSTQQPPLSNSAESVLANTPFLLTRCSSDLRYLFVSEAYARMLGREPSDVVGRKIRDVMGERGFNTILPHIEAVLSGQRVEYESQVHFEGVGPRLLHVIYTPEKAELGSVTGWIASIVDITEKREAQERLAADLHAAEALRAVASECVRDTATFDSCVQKLLDGAIDIAGAAKGSLHVFDPKSASLQIVAQRGFGTGYIEFFNTIKAEDAAACAVVMRSRCQALIPDISASDIFKGHASLDILTAEGIRAVSSFPLISSKGSILGVLSTHFTERHEPQARELRFLDLLTRMAADYLQRRQAEQTEKMLQREVQHRSNNLLALVQALAIGTRTSNDFDGFERRLHALARMNRRIASSDRMSLLDSVSVQLEPFASRVTIRGPDIMLTTEQSQNIGLAIHELTTNAAKYGALSNGHGTVRITWEEQPDSEIKLLWREQGGPCVAKPARMGFGTKLLIATFPKAHIDYAPDGLRCEFQLRRES